MCSSDLHELGERIVGLLPLGTGNDFARSVGIPLDIEDAARIIVEGEGRETDLIVDEVGEIVVNNVHLGAGAEASRKGHTWKNRLGSIGIGKLNLGKLGYPIGAVQSAFSHAELHLRVEIDGKSQLRELYIKLRNGGDVWLVMSIRSAPPEQ